MRVTLANREPDDRVTTHEMPLEPRLVRRRLGPRLRVIPLLVRQLEASGCVNHIGRHYLVAFGGIAVHVVWPRREAVRFAHKILRNPCAEPERCVLNTEGSAKATITIPLLPRLNSTNNSRVPCRRRCANARRHAPLKRPLRVCAPIVHGVRANQNQEEVRQDGHVVPLTYSRTDAPMCAGSTFVAFCGLRSGPHASPWAFTQKSCPRAPPPV